MKKVMLILLIILVLVITISCKPQTKVDCSIIKCQQGYVCENDKGCVELPKPICGDGTCESTESYLNCLADCPVPEGETPEVKEEIKKVEQSFKLELTELMIDVDGVKSETKGTEDDIDINPEWNYFENKKENEKKIFIISEEKKPLRIYYDYREDGRYDPLKDKAILGSFKPGEYGLPIWITNYAYNNVLGDYYYEIPDELLKEAEEKKVVIATDIILLEQRPSPKYCGDGKLQDDEECDFSSDDPRSNCIDSCLWNCKCVPLVFYNATWKQFVIGGPGGGAGAGAGQGGAGGAGGASNLMLLDEDKDGIPNNIDECPLEGGNSLPAGFEKAGCPFPLYPVDIVFVDSDNDEIWDHQDYCIEDPQGNEVAPLSAEYPGCTEEQLRKLKEGPYKFKPHTKDSITGAPLDLLDTDMDGVPNNLDKCPNTSFGTEVFPIGYSNAGCAVMIYPRDIVFIDVDHDGIWDHTDNCIGDPKGEPVAPAGSRYTGCTDEQISGG
ncbi:hypothetical protein COV11_00655 [Candidatus Woesearchaeota archaeon CG10_big_fil_rev_8_21_14_0_10_30_7]|nr:MAG: hypothetical protein COV11_00655 [Candidatus Woesearchaeota archaeon CG10_big_fil_rev_8_21_14_0_10_30_7]